MWAEKKKKIPAYIILSNYTNLSSEMTVLYIRTQIKWQLLLLPDTLLQGNNLRILQNFNECLVLDICLCLCLWKAAIDNKRGGQFIFVLIYIEILASPEYLCLTSNFHGRECFVVNKSRASTNFQILEV